MEAEVFYTYLHNDFRLVLQNHGEIGKVRLCSQHFRFFLVLTKRDTFINKIMFDTPAHTHAQTTHNISM